MTGNLDEAAQPMRAEETPAEPPFPEEARATPAEDLGSQPFDGQAREDDVSVAPSVEFEPIAAGREPSAPMTDHSAILLEAVAGLGDRLSLRLDAIQAALERDARAEATRERVVDRLHAELQEYKQDLLLKVQRPIFIDLIQLHDDIGKMLEARTSGDAELDRSLALRGILESIQVAIEDILYRQGVEPFTAEGDAFDPRRQRAIATATTDDPALNKMIAARLRKGFQAGEKLIRPEIISVYTFRPPPDASA
jgi:molecular chaperone GrpE